MDDPIARGQAAIGQRLAIDLVAIANAAGRLAVPHPPLQAPVGLLGEVLDVEGRHRAAKTDMHLVDLALGLGDDTDAMEAHLLVEAGDMLLVA